MTSAISVAAKDKNGKGMGTVTVAGTEVKAGALPYFCGNHKMSMKGVVYVE